VSLGTTSFKALYGWSLPSISQLEEGENRIKGVVRDLKDHDAA